jgi:putative ABC transport system permease protein
MKIWRIFKMALSSLKINKMRTFLSTLGIIVGVSSLILITSVGYGAQYSILSSIQSLGSDVIIIIPGKTKNLLSSAVSVGSNALRKPLTYDDAKYLKKKMPYAKIAPQLTVNGTVKFENTEISTTVVGTTPDVFVVSNYKLADGRALTDRDIIGYRNVCVLGYKVVNELFPSGNAIGKYIMLNGNKFLVVGTLREKGALGQIDLDDMVFIPITTLQTQLRTKKVQVIYAKPPEGMSVDVLGARIKSFLLARHGMENFTLNSFEQYMQLAKQVTDIFTIALAAIGSISLLVGGIGIMNIMLASVAERTREIGIRKAVGAKNSDILMQFLLESALISTSGGVIGIILGVLGAVLVPQSVLPTHITTAAVVIGFSVAFLIGVFFGVYPASKASKLNPVEALRYE